MCRSYTCAEAEWGERCIKILHGKLEIGFSPPRDDASGGFDQHIRVWDTHTGQLMATLVGHTGPVWGVALTDDGQSLCSGSFDGTMRLWNVHTGECLRTLRGERPYERMDIAGVIGLTDADRAELFALGAVERSAHDSGDW